MSPGAHKEYRLTMVENSGGSVPVISLSPIDLRGGDDTRGEVRGQQSRASTTRAPCSALGGEWGGDHGYLVAGALGAID